MLRLRGLERLNQVDFRVSKALCLGYEGLNDSINYESYKGSTPNYYATKVPMVLGEVY